jgi:tRNA nucleotidyltransferase/poly(A) polymerase
VGGTLRDLILGRQYSDFDFAVKGASILAKQYAYDTKSALVPLDTTPGRETFRVVIKKNVHFDFSELQGNTIESDLNQRDFSINALAISLPNFIQGTKKYIDPHSGQKDIQNKIIRVLPGSAFSKDPLRMLRAFRFMSILEFKIESTTLKKIKTLHSKINRVSPERIWNELNLLLSTKKASPTIQAMDGSGLLESIFPELYKNKKAPSCIKILNHVENLLSNPKQLGGKPLPEIKKLLLEKPQLIRLGSMLYPLTKKSSIKKNTNKKSNRKTITSKVLAKLRASNADIDFVGAMISCSHFVTSIDLSVTDSLASKIKIYQLIHLNEQGLIPGLFLYLANRSIMPKEKEWQEDSSLMAVIKILNFYFRTYLPAKIKNPLLNGNDLQMELKIKPNSMIKTILYKVEESRVIGIINTRPEAIQLAKKIILAKKDVD